MSNHLRRLSATLSFPVLKVLHYLAKAAWDGPRVFKSYNVTNGRNFGTIGGAERSLNTGEFAGALFAQRGMGKSMEKALSGSIAQIVALGFVAMFAAHANAQDDTTRQRRQGQSIVSNKCSSCHAIGRVGESPNPKAPPFRTLHERYPVESLAEAIAEGTISPDEPEFKFSGREVGAIISYLSLIQEP